MITQQELQTMTKDIKDNIEKQDQRIQHAMTKPDEIASKTSNMDHISEELEHKGTEFLSMKSVGQKI